MRCKIKLEGTPRKKGKRRGCSATGNYDHLKQFQFKPGNQMASNNHTTRLRQRFDKEIQAALLEEAPPELRKMAKLNGKVVVTTAYALTKVLIRLAGTGELDALLAIAKMNDLGSESLRAGNNTKIDARKQQVIQWVSPYQIPESANDKIIEGNATHHPALAEASSEAVAGDAVQQEEDRNLRRS